MSDVLKEFLVSIGFAADESQAKKVEATIAKTEAGITATQAAETAKRTATEEKASDARVTIAEALSRLLNLEEEKLSDARQKARKQDAERDQKAGDEQAKKAKERREAAVKSMQASALKLASFAAKAIAAVEATALGVVLAADKAAKSFDKLNYASRLSGASPSSMTAAGYASSQLGSSAEESAASLTDLGKKLAKFPGYEQNLIRLGIATRDAKGQLRDTAAIADDLGDRLARIKKEGGATGYVQAINQGAVFGLSENEVRARMDPRFKQLENEQRRIQGSVGADSDDAAKSGTAFEQSMRKLLSVIDAIKTKVETGVFKELTPELDRMAAWAEGNGSHIAEILGRIIRDIIRLASAVLNRLAKLDWDGILTKAENFVVSIDKTLTGAFGENGTTIAALAFFAVAVGSKVLGPLRLVIATVESLSKLPLVGRLFGLGAAAVAVGASAESTPTASVTADPIERAHKLADNTLPAGEMTQEEREAFSKAHGGGLWDFIKKKLGFGGADTSDPRVKDAILATAEATKKLAEKAEKAELEGGAGGGEGGGGGVMGAVRRTLGFAAVAAGGQAGRGGGPAALRSEQQKANAAAIADELRKAGAPDEGAAAVLGSMQTESSFNPRAHNDVTGGHTGLWQWDARRWPKIRAWIEKQGGDPWDARWQTRAYVAEGRAKPGDDIYDNGETSAGFDDVMNSKGNLPKAVHGVQRSERFGRGEEGGRAAHAAKWMGHLPGATDAAPAVAAAPSPTTTPAPVPDTSKDTPLDTPGLVHLPEYEAADKILSSKTATKAQKAAAQKVMDRWNSQSFPSKVAGAGPGQPVGTSTDTTPVPGPSSYPTLLINPKTGRKDTSGAPEIDHSAPVKVEVTDASAAKIGKATNRDRLLAEKAASEKRLVGLKAAAAEAHQHFDTMKLVAGIHKHGVLNPFLHHPFGVTPALRASIDNSRKRGDTHVSKVENYNIQGGDPRTMMAEARRTAGRGNADLMRNLQTMEV